MQEVCVRYWPEKDREVYGNLTVSNVGGKEINDAISTRVFEVYHNGSLAAVSPLHNINIMFVNYTYLSYTHSLV